VERCLPKKWCELPAIKFEDMVRTL
jgi:hypothetical protein